MRRRIYNPTHVFLFTQLKLSLPWARIFSPWNWRVKNVPPTYKNNKKFVTPLHHIRSVKNALTIWKSAIKNVCLNLLRQFVEFDPRTCVWKSLSILVKIISIFYRLLSCMARIIVNTLWIYGMQTKKNRTYVSETNLFFSVLCTFFLC
jgi:hypothetical protein